MNGKKLFFFPFPLLAAKRYLGDGGEAVEEEKENRRGRSASHENIMSGGGTPFAASPFPPLLDRAARKISHSPRFSRFRSKEEEKWIISAKWRKVPKLGGLWGGEGGERPPGYGCFFAGS